MTSTDIHKHLIYCTLTINSTTLFTYENHQLTSHLLGKLNCSEVVSQELGLINSSKTLIGSIPAGTNTSHPLSLYFMKKFLTVDGSRDLITIVVVAHSDINKTFVLLVLKNIMDKYIEFKKQQEAEANDKSPSQRKTKSGEFKIFMNQIIKYEEANYILNQQVYNNGNNNNTSSNSSARNNNQHKLNSSNKSYSNYGSTDQNGTDAEGHPRDQISANQLLLANEEVDEVRELMLENINKLLSRGDKINSLVDQTDRLNTSSLLFQKKAQQIKRKMWFHKTKFILSITGGGVLLLYLIAGSECGYPFFELCRP